jgi:hypothetical protein
VFMRKVYLEHSIAFHRISGADVENYLRTRLGSDR